MKAMRDAVAKLSSASTSTAAAPDAVLVDGNRCPWGNPEGKMAKGGVRPADPPAPANLRRCIAVVKGDGHVRAIAAASVLAKVHRDRLCQEHHALYPEYGIDSHKGNPLQHTKLRWPSMARLRSIAYRSEERKSMSSGR